VRGTVEKVSADSLVVKTRRQAVEVKIAASTVIRSTMKTNQPKASDLAAGTCRDSRLAKDKNAGG